jgi:hypothetical protein
MMLWEHQTAHNFKETYSTRIELGSTSCHTHIISTRLPAGGLLLVEHVFNPFHAANEIHRLETTSYVLTEQVKSLLSFLDIFKLSTFNFYLEFTSYNGHKIDKLLHVYK